MNYVIGLNLHFIHIKTFLGIHAIGRYGNDSADYPLMDWLEPWNYLSEQLHMSKLILPE